MIESPNWIQTFCGHKFYIDIPDIFRSEIDLDDIAHALSNICRFNGHCKQFYSVATHSLQVFAEIRSLIPPEEMHEKTNLLLGALLHDAAEAYLCDLPRPYASKFFDLKYTCEMIQNKIEQDFRIYLNHNDRELIKLYDTALLKKERDLLFNNIKEWDFPAELPELKYEIDLDVQNDYIEREFRETAIRLIISKGPERI